VITPGTFRGRQAADQLAGRDARQDGGLLGVAAVGHHGLGQDIDRRGEGDRRHGPAQLLGDGAQLHPPQAQAVVFLGNGRAQPALLGHGAPQSGVVALGRIVEHAAHHRGGTAGGEELARLVLQELLVVGIVEIHLDSLPWRPLL
jgi:hypothetical protein